VGFTGKVHPLQQLILPFVDQYGCCYLGFSSPGKEQRVLPKNRSDTGSFIKT
jgi:hypothetical protein